MAGKLIPEKANLTTVRMRPSLLLALNKAAEDWGVSKTRILDEALTARLGLGAGEGLEAGVPEKLQPCLKMLAELLASGNEDLIGLVVRPLEYALKEVQKRAGQQRKAGL